MADIFSDIAGAVTKPIGGLLSGAARGLFPGAARQADIKVESIQHKKDMEQFGLYMSIMKDQTGTWSEQAKKAAADSMRRSPIFKQVQGRLGGAPIRGQGWAGGMGAGLKGMEAIGAKVNPMTGEMEMSYEKPGQFGDIPGAYGLLPPEKRAGVAEQALTKPGTSVQVGVKMPPAGIMTKMSQLYEFGSKLDYINDLVFDPDVQKTVGPLINRWEKFKESYPIPGTTRPTSDQVVFRQMIGMIADDLLRMKSGAAISIPEFERLMKLMPDPKLPLDSFMPKLRGLMRAIKITTEANRRILRETGYIVPGETELPTKKGATKEKNITDMTDEEIDAELRRMK